MKVFAKVSAFAISVVMRVPSTSRDGIWKLRESPFIPLTLFHISEADVSLEIDDTYWRHEVSLLSFTILLALALRRLKLTKFSGVFLRFSKLKADLLSLITFLQFSFHHGTLRIPCFGCFTLPTKISAASVITDTRYATILDAVFVVLHEFNFSAMYASYSIQFAHFRFHLGE